MKLGNFSEKQKKVALLYQNFENFLYSRYKSLL